MTTVEQLRAEKALIDTPEKFVEWQYALPDAKLANGKDCTYRNKKAARYSLIGAWRKSGKADLLSAFCAAIGDSRKCMADFAKLPHADIMAIFDRAIADAEQAEVQS